jgi:hypothetical protein
MFLGMLKVNQPNEQQVMLKYRVSTVLQAMLYRIINNNKIPNEPDKHSGGWDEIRSTCIFILPQSAQCNIIRVLC